MGECVSGKCRRSGACDFVRRVGACVGSVNGCRANAARAQAAAADTASRHRQSHRVRFFMGGWDRGSVCYATVFNSPASAAASEYQSAAAVHCQQPRVKRKQQQSRHTLPRGAHHNDAVLQHNASQHTPICGMFLLWPWRALRCRSASESYY